MKHYAEDELIKGDDLTLIGHCAWYIADCANRLYKLSDGENYLTAWALKRELDDIQEELNQLKEFCKEDT